MTSQQNGYFNCYLNLVCSRAFVQNQDFMGDRRIPLFYQCFPFRVRFACVRYVRVCMRASVLLFFYFVCLFFFHFFFLFCFLCSISGVLSQLVQRRICICYRIVSEPEVTLSRDCSQRKETVLVLEVTVILVSSFNLEKKNVFQGASVYITHCHTFPSHSPSHVIQNQGVEPDLSGQFHYP